MHVAAGTYTGGFKTTASGTATARIRYVSDTKWGAKIIPSGSSSNIVAWDNRGNYVDIDGFEINGQAGPTWRVGLIASGSYVVIKNNHIHDIATTVTCDNNGGSAISTDHYSYGVHDDVIGNVFHHVGSPTCLYIQGIYLQTSGDVKNNLVYQIGGAAIHTWHDATNSNIVNNTVFGSTTGILIGTGEYYHMTGPGDYFNVSNNIVFDNLKGIGEQSDGTGIGGHNTYTNNLVFQNSVYNWSLKNTHSGDVTASPQFVNYIRTGGGDYHLKSTSPAIDKGRATYAPSIDLDLTVRPQGAAIDIGAYEYEGL